MSRHQDSFELPCPPETAKQICAYAIPSLGLTIDRDLGHGFVCSEKLQFGFTWPVTLNVTINQTSAGGSQINIAGSNFGFGPIQSSHVKDRVAGLRRRIEELWRQPQVANVSG